MEKRILGRTGLVVSVIGMGGIPIQRVSEAEAAEILQLALRQGISFYDTARAYTNSERKFGTVFGNLSEGPVIASKSMARDRDNMAGDIQTSLDQMRVKKIDLYQLHNVKDKHTLARVLGPGGALEALKEAKAGGKIKYIGITGHIPGVLVEALKSGEFDTVQFPYNPVEREAEKELIPLAQQMNVGMIVMKPLAGGAFKNPVSAMKFLLNSPVSTIIPGIDRLEQVEQNAALGSKIEPLTAEEQSDLEADVVRLGENFCRRCEYCQPCPEGIDIPLIFLLDGYWTRYGLQDWAVDRYRPLATKASACLECGLCEEKCPYRLPIRQMLKESRLHLER